MSHILDKIRETIKNQGISEARLAKMVGMNQKTLNNLLAGRTKRFDPEKIEKIQAALGIDSSDASVTPITGTSREGLSFSEKAVGQVGEQQETQTVRQRLGGQDFSPQVLQMAGFLDLMTKDMTDEERDAFARELFEETVQKLRDRKK